MKRRDWLRSSFGALAGLLVPVNLKAQGITLTPSNPTFGAGSYGYDLEVLNQPYWDVVYPDIATRDLSGENLLGPFLDGWNAQRFVQSLTVQLDKNKRISTWLVRSATLFPLNVRGYDRVYVALSSREITRWTFPDKGRADEFVSKVRVRPHTHESRKKFGVQHPTGPVLFSGSYEACADWIKRLRGIRVPAGFVLTTISGLYDPNFCMKAIEEVPLFAKAVECDGYMRQLKIAEIVGKGQMEVAFEKLTHAQRLLIAANFGIPDSFVL